jgi:hypothetical protein
MLGYFPLDQWEQENFKNEPRICRRCGGLGRCRGLIRRTWRRCSACRGTGGAIDDERAWWRASR